MSGSRGTSFRGKQDLVAVASGGAVSSWFVKQKWADSLVLLTPAALNAGDIGIQVSLDGGTTPIPVIDFATQVNAVLLSSGVEVLKAVEFGELVKSFQQDNNSANQVMLRFTCTAQAGGARVLTVVQRG